MPPTERPIISQSQTPLLANHHLINYYCARYSAVHHAAVLCCSTLRGLRVLSMGLMRSLRLGSFRATGPHLATCNRTCCAVQHIPAHLGPFLPTAPEFAAGSLAPRAREAEARWFNVWDGTLYHGTK